MKRLALLVVLLAPACGILSSGEDRESRLPPITDIHYRVRVPDPTIRELEVEIDFQAPGRDSVVVGLPAWTLIPEIRDLARYVINVTAHDKIGRSLKVQYEAKDLWRITLQGNSDLNVRYRVRADGSAPTGNQLTDDFAYFVGGATFLFIDEALQQPARVSIEAPDGWEVVTGLERGENGDYRAEHYETLIENPVALGQFRYVEFSASREVAGVQRTLPLKLVVDCREENFEASLNRLRDRLQTLVLGHLQLMRDVPRAFESEYLFLVLLDAGSEVDGFGFPGAAVLTGTPEGMMEDDLPLVRVASREFGHVWFGGRVPKGEATPAILGREFYSMVYWVIYGWSAYYGDLVLCRSGLLSEQELLQTLASDIAQRRVSLTRELLSPAASSYLIWFYRYPEWSRLQSAAHPRRVGRLLAMAIDLYLRENTLNNKSLDTVVRELEDLFGNIRRRLTMADILDAVSRSLGQPILREFGKYIYQTDEPVWDDYLAWVGLRLESEVRESGIDTGFEVKEPFAGRFFITKVAEEGPAQRVGIRVGDEILSIDGEAAPSTPSILAHLEPGENLELTLRGADGTTREVTVDVRAALERRLRIIERQGPEVTVEQRESGRNNRRLWLSPQMTLDSVPSR
ncbi:MAG: PDZ domain-containing protein [Planctomycetota bacterium]